MCRRYVSPDQLSIDEEFDLVRSEWQFAANFNTAPLDAVPVIRVIDDQPDTALLKWGFGDPVTYSVTIEMLHTAHGDRGLLAHGQRCIVPALGYYEWRLNASGSRQPFYVHVEDQPVCGFAGFWERESCVVVTVPAAAGKRMPAILRREMRDVWLYGSALHAAAALTAYPDAALVTYAVSARVNSPANNDENLIEPLAADID